MTSAPRVAYFPDSYGEVNGVAHTSRMFSAYAVRHDLPFLCVHAGSRTRHRRISRTVSHHELERGPLSFGLDGDLRYDLRIWRHRQAVEALLKRFSPDLIHVTGPNDAGQLGAWLAHRLDIPLVVSWHTNLHDFAGQRLHPLLASLPPALTDRTVKAAERYSLRLLHDFYRLGRIVLAPNPELVETLSRATKGPVHLMERGVDTDLFTPGRRQRTDTTFRIGYVGRLTPEKNVRALASIEARLRHHGLRDYRFVVVGDGSERPWLERHLVQADFAGVLRGAALANAYADLDVFVFPSETDTFGNVVLEAQASGIPTLVSRGGGPKFLIRDGVTGKVCADADTMGDTIADLAHDSDRMATARRAARSHALERSWDRVFERVYDAYRAAPFAPRRGRSSFRSREFTIVARAVYQVFQLTARTPAPPEPLVPSGGMPVTP